MVGDGHAFHAAFFARVSCEESGDERQGSGGDAPGVREIRANSDIDHQLCRRYAGYAGEAARTRVSLSVSAAAARRRDRIRAWRHGRYFARSAGCNHRLPRWRTEHVGFVLRPTAEGRGSYQQSTDRTMAVTRRLPER